MKEIIYFVHENCDNFYEKNCLALLYKLFVHYAFRRKFFVCKKPNQFSQQGCLFFYEINVDYCNHGVQANPNMEKCLFFTRASSLFTVYNKYSLQLQSAHLIKALETEQRDICPDWYHEAMQYMYTTSFLNKIKTSLVIVINWKKPSFL